MLMALWMVVIISNLSNSICKVAENKNAIVQRLLDVIHKPFQAAVNRSAIWLAKRHNDTLRGQGAIEGLCDRSLDQK